MQALALKVKEGDKLMEEADSLYVVCDCFVVDELTATEINAPFSDGSQIRNRLRLSTKKQVGRLLLCGSSCL